MTGQMVIGRLYKSTCIIRRKRKVKVNEEVNIKSSFQLIHSVLYDS